MADLRTVLGFPHLLFKHATSWRDRVSWIPSTRVSLGRHRGAPVLRKLSIGLALIGLAFGLVALPALAADLGSPSQADAGPESRPVALPGAAMATSPASRVDGSLSGQRLEAALAIGDPTAFLILLPGESATPGQDPGRTGEPESVIVGQTTSVEIWAVDVDWNPVVDFAGTLDLTTTDVLATLPDTAILADGTAVIDVTWMTAGNQTLTATDQTDPLLTGSAEIEVYEFLIPGLKAEYFNNISLTPPADLIRTDDVVDFTWGLGSPDPEISATEFSARWTGQVEADYSDTYEFITLSDDGVRLWIDDALLIDNWTEHGETRDSGIIDLVAGQKYSLRMEYFELEIDATARLLWNSPSFDDEMVIPVDHLSHADLSNSTVEATPSSLIADNLETATVTIHLVNAFGVPIVGEEVYLNVSGSHNRINGFQSGGDDWVSIGLSDAAGQVVAGLTSTVAELKTIHARAGGTHLDEAPTVEFRPGQPNQLMLLLPGEVLTPGDDPGKGGEVSPVIVNRPSFVLIAVVDANWNTVNTFATDVQIESTDPAADIPGIVNMPGGDIWVGVTWRTLGPQTLTATSVSDPSLTDEILFEVVVPPELVVGDGEVVTVDDVRYRMTEFVEEEQNYLPYDGTPGFNTGDRVLIIVMQGEAIGTYETAIVDEVQDDRLDLNDDLRHAYDGTSNRVMVQRVPEYGAVTVQAGGRITAHAWDGETGGVVFLRADDITVEAGGTIDVSGLGFRVDEGPGSGGLRSGGGYGGYGGDDPGKNGIGGVGYGSALEPVMLSSAGGNAYATDSEGAEIGGPGGGVLWLDVADTLRVDGELRSNGVSRMLFAASQVGGGGAGGSLNLTAGTLAGSGMIQATGGNSLNSDIEFTTYFGGGSGGRISVSFAQNTFSGTWRAFGGQTGSSPGTIFLNDRSLARTSLRVDFGLADGRPAILTDPEATDWDFDRIELTRNADLELLDPDDTIDLTSANMAGDGTGQIHLHYPFQLTASELRYLGLYIHTDGELILPGVFTVRGAELSVYGRLSGINELTLATDGGVNPLVRLVATGHSESQPVGTFELDTVVVHTGGKLELASDPEAERGLTLLANTLTIDSGGRVSGDGLGYQIDGYRGPGAGISGSGAGHGGFGGGGGGIPYGSALQPVALGSAGGGTGIGGGAGGGAIHIVANSLYVGGVLSSDGMVPPRFGGGGAGGSLWLEVGSVSGAGVIRANGGHNYIFQTSSGSGGGGRIALVYTTSTFSGTIQAAGGPEKNMGGPGTIALTDVNTGFRKLLVDNLGQAGRQAGLTDPGPTVWTFDEIELVRNGHLELLDPDDTILLTGSNTSGDGTAAVYFHGALDVNEPLLADFGFYVYESGALGLPANFTLSGVPLTNFGSVEGAAITVLGGTLTNHGLLNGVSSLTIRGGAFVNDGGLDGLSSLNIASGGVTPSVTRLKATGGTVGQPLGTYEVGQILVEGGQRLELESDAALGRGVVLVADQVTVQSGGRISADGLGYLPSVNPGPGEGGDHGGGGHGGYGGGEDGGQPYGSIRGPDALGSVGWHQPGISFIHGQPGGGAIKILADTVELDGILTVNGADSHDTRESASAGGSIWLEVNTLSGEGVIQANGGGTGGGSGAGSGGRIALYLVDNAFVGSITAFGGHSLSNVGDGGPGTVYLEDLTEGQSQLKVDNRGVEAPPAALLDPDTTVWAFDRIELTRNGHLELHDPDDDILLSPANMAGDGTSMLFFQGDRAYSESELIGFGFYVAEGQTLSVPDALTLRGTRMQIEGVLDGATDLTLAGSAGANSTLTLTAVGHSLGQPLGTYALGDVAVEAGQLVRLTGDPVHRQGVVVRAGQMTVAGHISADGAGFPAPNAGPGIPWIFGSGAGHGGAGGGPGGGPTYGSATAPETLGSSAVTAGGGAIRLILTGTLTLDATSVISADAGDRINTSSGAGAGGSIWITAPQVLGQGAIHADGGDITGPFGTGSGGGGGRIKIEAGFTSTQLELRALGGTGSHSGQPGSVFVESVGFPTDLRMVKTGPAEAIPGTMIEYTLSARNEGQARAEAVVLQDTLAADVSYVSDNAPVPAEQDGTSLSWNLGDIDPGQRVTFSVVVRVSPTAGVGAQLVNQATATTETQDEVPANNIAMTTANVVTGFRYTASLTPPSRSLGLGASGEYSVTVQNMGLLLDQYDLEVTGLDTDWYALSESRISLAPGATKVVTLTVQVDDCAVTGQVPFSVSVSSDGGADTKTLNGNLVLNTAPTLSGLLPANGATVGARDVLLQWRSDVPTVGLLTLYPEGQPEAALTFETELRQAHSVLVEGLTRNSTYQWTVQATSSCGVALSQPRTFTVGNGIVFKTPTMSFEIDRDYDQRVPVQVTNQDNLPHTLKVEIQNPYDDLIVNFVGSGSVDETITLLTGETRSVTLAIHAQDAVQRDYDLAALLTADEGTSDPISDQATVHVRVLAEADYVIEETGLDPVTGARSFRVTNHGKTITDLEIVAVDPTTGDPARVYLNPNVTHARLTTDETLTFEVVPIFGPEDVDQGIASSSPGTQGLAMPVRADIIPYELISTAAGQIQRMVAQASCPEGNSVYPVTRGPVLMRFPATGWYCTNRPEIKVPFDIPAFVNPANVTGVRVRARFEPKSGVRPHNTDVSLNGTQIGSLEDTVPSGTYEFDVPPEALRSGLTGTVQQEIEIDSQHPNGGHYVVATDFEVLVAVDSVTIYVCAGSQEEAEAAVDDLYDLIPLPSQLAVSVNWPHQGMVVKPEADGRINLQARVDDDLPAYFEYYNVQATIDYLDQPLPSQTVTLFDDGNVADHGDLDPRNDYYNTLWAPEGSGMVRLTVEASAPNGLTATDSITFTVEALPDFAVTRVWQETISLFNQKANIRAELTNLGSPVMGPILVRFDYYAVDDETGQPVGSPVHSSLWSVLNGLLFERNALIVVEDEQFTAPKLGLFYVIVTVDP